MLAILISWVVVGVMFITFGDMTSRLYAMLTRQKLEPNILDLFLLGMPILGSVIAICSLFVPANMELLWVLAFIAVVYISLVGKLLRRVARNLREKLMTLPRYLLAIIPLIFLSIAAYCTIAPYWYDTLFYHMQNVMWNAEYSVVPGLANLQPRFGFNSNYLLLVSSFGLRPVFGQFIFGVHSLVFAAIWVWVLCKAYVSSSLLKSVLALTSISILSFFYKEHISSISTDFLPNLLLLYIVLRILFDGEIRKASTLSLFALIAYSITLKLSMALLCIICLYILWQCVAKRDYKQLTALTVVGLLVAVPWLVRNLILSGYLIFPYPSIDLFSFDWKVPLEYVQEQKDFIGVYARQFIPFYSMEEAMSLSFGQTVRQWWTMSELSYMPGRAYIWAVIVSCLLSLGIWAVAVVRRGFGGVPVLYLLHLVSFLSLVVWFVSAPALRFMFGFVLAFVLLSLYLLLSLSSFELSEKISRKLVYLGIGLSALFLLQFSAKYVYFKMEDRGFSYYKPESIHVAREHMVKHYYAGKRHSYERVDVNGVEIYKSTGGDYDIFTYDNPLPTSRDYVGGISLRGKGLQEGFRCLDGYPHRKLYIDEF